MARELKHYIIKTKSDDTLDTLISDVMGMGVKIEHIYRHVFSGFSAPLTDLYAKNIGSDPRVEYVEEATEFTTYARQEEAPWHLDRIDQRVLPLSDSYTYDSAGTGVIAYVLDSGCVFFNPNKEPSDVTNFDHVEFGGRVSSVNKVDNIGVPIPNTTFDPIYDRLQILDPENSRLTFPRGFDQYAHGTHVSGLIGSQTYGVAKNISIRSAKVLDVYGRGLSTDVVAGIEAILGDYIYNSGGSPAVCNMSLGGRAPAAPPPAGSVELAVQSLIDAGITVVVAAGNEGQDANNVTPARIPDAITVGATGRVISQGVVVGDTIAIFSNFGDNEDIIADESFGFNDSIATNTGSAVDIFAPGVSVTSTINSNPYAVATFSGTSMASPIVAGVAALILENNPALSPIDVSNIIKVNSVEGIIDGVPAGTPNRMLFSTIVDHEIEWVTSAGDLGGFPEGFTLNPEVRIEATGFSGVPLTYSNPTGGLPPGVTINSATGVLEGTAPIVLTDTVYNFVIKAADSSGFVTRSFSLTVLDGELPPNWLTDSDLSSIEEGEDLNIQLVASSRSLPATPVTYSVVDGNGNPNTLPYGWNLTPSGILVGTVPIVINDDYLVTFIVRADDAGVFADREFSILINQSSYTDQPVWQTGGDLGEIIRDDAVVINILATDADGNPLPVKYKLNVDTASGSDLGGSVLPQGLTLNEDTGLISGSFTGDLNDGALINPTVFDGNTTTFDNNTTTVDHNEAIFEFQIFAVDGAFAVGRLFTLKIANDPANEPVTWITPSSSLGSANALELVSFAVEAYDPDNGPQELEYTLTSGILPSGLFLNSSSGVISGVPNNITETELSYIFGIKASDGSSAATRTFSITVQRVNRQPLWITPPGLLIPPINEGQIFSFQLEAEDPNGEDDLTYTVINNVVNQMLLDNNTTTFDGNTTTMSDQQAIESALPPGLVLDSDTGILSGNILDVGEDTTYYFTIRVDDSKSNTENETLFVDRQFSIEVVDGNLNVNQEPTWITPSGALPGGIEEELYRYELLAEDTDGPQPLRFIIVAGALPDGVALNATTGVISGFPNDADTEDSLYEFTVRASDGAFYSDRLFSIYVTDTAVVNLPPIWITPTGSIGSYNELSSMIFALSATDPEGENVAFIDSTNSLPVGLVVTVDGIINGIPPQVASDQVFNFSIDAVDESGNITTQEFFMTVVDVPNIPPVWVTDPSLGSFAEGVLTPVVLTAIDPDAGPSPTLIYTDTSGSGTHLPEVPFGATIGLPPGLSVSINGIITGTSVVTEDTLFSFEITASDGAANIPEQFLMTITDVADIPDDKSSLSVRITGNSRQEFKSWNTPSLIFDSELFEPNNPMFGRTSEPEIFIMNNIHTINPSDIPSAFGAHHATFDALAGVLQSAVVRDVNDDILYEVVYLDIIDPQAGSSFDIVGDYLTRDDPLTLPNETVSRNFDHLRTELQALPNSEKLPDWMTAEQIENDEESVLGYTPSVVLAYVKPGYGKEILDRLNEISVTEETISAKETTFDINTVIGQVFEPVVGLGDSLTITNGTNAPVEVVFTAPYTLLQIVQDINNAGIDGIVAASDLVELFIPDVPATTWPGEFQTDHVLVISFDQPEATFSSGVLSNLGLPSVGKETFWNDGSTFDNSASTKTVVEKGQGYEFTGRKLTVDRYLFDDNITDITQITSFDGGDLIFDNGETTFDLVAGDLKWIKFSSDTNVPSWVTNKGILAGFATGDAVSISLEAASQVAGILEYSLIYGALPDGLTLNIDGTITGTVLAGNDISNYFVVRATKEFDRTDINDVGPDIVYLTSDRGFDILIDGPVTFDSDLTTFDGDSTTFSSP